MRLQRTIAAVVIAGAAAGLAFAGRQSPVPLTASFAFLGEPTMPFVPSGSFITSSWFCPGVPNGQDGVGGNVVIANPSDQPLAGRITVYGTDATAPVSQLLSVAARTSITVTLSDVQPVGTFLSAVVEVDGGGGFVEQQAIHPAGNAVAACANAASSHWYFADGFTAADSEERLILTNPYPDAAIVDIGFVTKDGVRKPSRLQGYPVPGRSVQVVELGAKDESILASKVVASRGRIVAGRAQNQLGAGRLGYSMTLGAPSLSSQLYFADGEAGAGITEVYRIFNPTDQDVTVDAVFLGLPVTDFQNDQQISVPAGGVGTLDTALVRGLPAGRHGAVFSTFAGDSVVVERILTRPAGRSIATTVVVGSPSTLASTRWSGAIGSDLALDDVLVVLNVDNVDTIVKVSTLGPGGWVPVPGMDALALPANGVITIAITDPSALGTPFRVEGTQRMYVERLLARGGDLRGRSGSFALAG